MIELGRREMDGINIWTEWLPWILDVQDFLIVSIEPEGTSCKLDSGTSELSGSLFSVVRADLIVMGRPPGKKVSTLSPASVFPHLRNRL